MGKVGYIIGREISSIYDISVDEICVYVFKSNIKNFVIDLFSAEPIANIITNEFEYTRNKLTRINIEVAKHCNLSCVHCYASANIIEPKAMANSLFVNCLQQIKALDYNVDIKLTGGEPTMNSEILSFCSEVMSNINFISKHTILTNFTSSLKLYEDIIRTGMKIQVSLYGITYSQFRSFTGGTLGQYSSIIRNLTKFPIEQRGNICLAIYDTTFSDVTNDCIKFAKENQYPFFVSGINNVGRARNSNISRINNNNIRKVSYINNRLCETNRICINYDGYVTPCPYLSRDKNYYMGNIQDTSLIDILEGERFREFDSATIDDVPYCKECPLKYLCSGGCSAEVVASTGARFNRYPRCLLSHQFGRIENDKIYKVSMYNPGNFSFLEYYDINKRKEV